LDIQDKLHQENDIATLRKMYSDLQVVQQEYQTKTVERKILIDDTLQIFFDVINKNEQYILDEIKLKKGKAV